MLTYRMSVKPSACSNSCATYCGATQMPAIWERRSLVVSGAGSAATGRKPRTPVVATAAKPPTNSRRLHDWARLSAMVSPLARPQRGDRTCLQCRKQRGNSELLSGWHRADTAWGDLQLSGSRPGRTGGESLVG